MTIQYSVPIRNARLDAIESTIGVTAKLIIYTGAPPANCAAAASGSVLATLTLPSDWMAAAASGTKAKSGTWSGTASASGTAGHFRIWDNAVAVCGIQGTVGTSAADMIVDSTSFTNGQAFSVLTMTITAGNP